MRGLVLTAGLGTRLQPLTLARAKAAAPVDGEPLARRTIRWLVGHDITDLVLNLHHKPESIAAAVGDGDDLGARVRYSWESPVLGSAGGPRHALPLLLDPPSPQSGFGGTSGEAERTFVLVNGDTLTNVDLPAMIARAPPHRRAGHDGADSESAARQVRRRAAGRRTHRHRVHAARQPAAGTCPERAAASRRVSLHRTAGRRSRRLRLPRGRRPGGVGARRVPGADGEPAGFGARLRQRRHVPGHRDAGGSAPDLPRPRRRRRPRRCAALGTQPARRRHRARPALGAVGRGHDRRRRRDHRMRRRRRRPHSGRHRADALRDRKGRARSSRSSSSTSQPRKLEAGCRKLSYDSR